MKKVIVILAAVVLVALIATIGQTCIKFDLSRDYSYEHYCDSIWENDPDYYMDVLMEGDEYQNYIEEHGKWWLFTSSLL